MRSLVALVVGSHLAAIQGRSVRNEHLVAVGLACHYGEAVLYLGCHVRGDGELLLVGEEDELAVIVVDLEADGARAVHVVGGQPLTCGRGVVVAIGLVFVHEVAPLADVGIADGHFAVVVGNAVSSARPSLERTVVDGGRGLDAVVDEADAGGLGIAMHVGLGFLDVLFGGRHPVVGIVAHIELVVRNEHAVHLEELAQVELGGVAHLLSHVQVVLAAIAHVASHHAVLVGKGSIVVARTLADRIFAQHLEERGIEVGLVSLCMEVEVELEVEACLFPDVHAEPSFALGEVIEGIGHLRASGCGDAVQEDVDVGEEVVADLGGSDDVEASLMVVPYLVRGSPNGAAAGGEGVVVHDGANGAVAVIGAVGGGVHVAVGDREGVPDIAEAALDVLLEAHQVFLALHEVVPDAHQAFHLIGGSGGSGHEFLDHGEDEAMRLEVEDVALVKHLFAEEPPVLVGHAAGIVEVALQLSALDVNLGSGIVGKILLGVVELIEDVDGAGVAENQGVQSGMERGCGACLMVARAVAVHHDFSLQGAVGAGFLVDVDVDDVAGLAHDAGRSGELAVAVAHAGVFVPRHLLVVAVDVEVVADAEELLEAFACIAVRGGKALPGVVLHLEHHCLHVVVEGGEVGILGQRFVAEALYLVLEDGAGIVLEEIGKGGLVDGEVLPQVVVGIELRTSLCDECLVQFHFLKAPDAVGGIAGPSDHDIAVVAVEAYGIVVEDVIGQRGGIVGPLYGEAGRLACDGAVLHAEGAVLLCDVTLCAEVLEVPASV